MTYRYNSTFMTMGIVGIVVFSLATADAWARPAALSRAGQTVAWGQAIFGEIGNATAPPSQPLPTRVLLKSGVKAVALSHSDTSDTEYAIGSDGNVYAWGGNEAGQLGNGSSNDSSTLTCSNGPNPFPCAMTPVRVKLPIGVAPRAVAAGTLTGYAIGSDGKLYAWGNGAEGELGDGTYGVSTCTLSGASYQCTDTPVVVQFPAGVSAVSVSGGGATAYAIGSDGNLYAWGGNRVGQLGIGTVSPGRNKPIKVTLPPDVNAAQIVGSDRNAYLLSTAGALYSWGLGSTGMLGAGSRGSTACSGDTCQTRPALVPLPAPVPRDGVGGGSYSAYAIAGQALYVWGSDENGSLGGAGVPDTCTQNGSTFPCSLSPAALIFPSGTPRTVASYGVGAFVASSDGNLYAWGWNLAEASGTGSADGSVRGARVMLPGSYRSLLIGTGYVNGYATLR